jgi:ketosteroid isomerase-like protein
MSQENVEIVRRAYDRFNDGDIDGFLQLCAPEFEFRDIAELPGAGVFIGFEAVRGWWDQLYDAFEDLRFDAEEFIEAGDRVLVPSCATGRGRSSGAPVVMRFSNVWALGDRKLVTCTAYNDHAEALEAAGLSE